MLSCLHVQVYVLQYRYSCSYTFFPPEVPNFAWFYLETGGKLLCFPLWPLISGYYVLWLHVEERLPVALIDAGCKQGGPGELTP